MRAPPPRPEFALHPAQAVDAALRAIVISHGRYAARLLRDARIDPHVAIHESRRALRRLRAVMLLLRPRLGARYDRVIAPLREAGRLLSPLRDRQSMHEAVSALEHATRDRLDAPTAAALRQRLGHPGTRGDTPIHAAMTQAIAQIEAARPLLSGAIAGTTREDLLAGLRVSLRRARQAMQSAAACADEPNMHRWRRRVRALWLQWELLAPLWPRGLSSVTRECRRVSQRLGMARDLDLLAQRLSRWRKPLGAQSVEAVLASVVARRTTLNASAARASALLLAESPNAVVRRLNRYWQLGAQSAVSTAGELGAGA